MKRIPESVLLFPGLGINSEAYNPTLDTLRSFGHEAHAMQYDHCLSHAPSASLCLNELGDEGATRILELGTTVVIGMSSGPRVIEAAYTHPKVRGQVGLNISIAGQVFAPGSNHLAMIRKVMNGEMGEGMITGMTAAAKANKGMLQVHLDPDLWAFIAQGDIRTYVDFKPFLGSAPFCLLEGVIDVDTYALYSGQRLGICYRKDRSWLDPQAYAQMLIDRKIPWAWWDGHHMDLTTQDVEMATRNAWLIDHLIGRWQSGEQFQDGEFQLLDQFAADAAE